MINTIKLSGKVFYVILFCLVVVCIYLFVSNSNSNNYKTGFKDVGPFQQYWLDPYAYDPYFAKDIYIVPGQARLAHNLNTNEYDSSYLPYESAIPAIDVLRANNKNNGKILPPSYFTQVIRHNTTPYSQPIVLLQ
jgi:hypothetical protein